MEHHNSKNQSLEAVTAKNSKLKGRGKADIDDCGGGGGESEDRTLAESSIGAEATSVAQSETLVTAEPDVRLSSGDQLSEVPVEFALEPLKASEGTKDQVRQDHHQNSVRAPVQAAQVEAQNKHSPDDPSSSDLSPTSVTLSSSTISSSIPYELKLPPKENTAVGAVKEKGKQNSLNQKSLAIVPLLKKTSPDGYNWRKYGQKQVKSPQGSRSYYRCTYTECYAKKIECADHTSQVVEIVYRCPHNHEPLCKASSLTESRLGSSAIPVNGHKSTTHSVTIHESALSPSKDTVQNMAPASETKEQSAAVSDDDSETNDKDGDFDEPETKKRLKESSSDCSGSQVKSGKKPKFVVHAAGDVGISGDGYRWRKYGQKMVKGNPHPRNYYRCTSAGCPVRKHIERAVDNANAVVITYKSVHDHDMPVPKKHRGLANAPFTAAAAPASMSNIEAKKSEHLQNQILTTKWSVDKQGELTGEPLELGRKAIESARTLLSIGFEIKPC